ncbi:MAG TPA: hypothetical protein VGP12_07145 [Nitrosospira sp.]|nr:hypothetical protein [Nitrosospira sp.]
MKRIHRAGIGLVLGTVAALGPAACAWAAYPTGELPPGVHSFGHTLIPNPCRLATQADVARITGGVSSVDSSYPYYAFGDLKAQGCRYDLEPYGGLVFLVARDSDQNGSGWQHIKATHSPELGHAPVSGLGDEAYYTGGDLLVRKGTLYMLFTPDMEALTGQASNREEYDAILEGVARVALSHLK